MKTNFTRSLCILLAALCLACSLTGLIACRSENGSETSTVQTGNESQSTEQESQNTPPVPEEVYYTITLAENGKTKDVTLKRGESYTPYTPAERDGYVFVGWYLGNELITQAITPDRDLTIQGVWEEYDLLAEELKESLRQYLSSEQFTQSIVSAKTTQARLPLLYLRYIKGNYYTNEVVVQFKTYLNMIKGIYQNGTLKDSLFPASAAGKQGWYGICDYLYSWSLIYNQYQQWCQESGNTDTSYSIYFPAIRDYLTYVDSYYSDTLYEFEDQQLKLSALSVKVLNCVNNFTNDNYRLSGEAVDRISDILKNATGNDDGYAAFLEKYHEVIDNYDTMTSEERNAAKTELKELWKSCAPSIQCAFGYNIYSVLTLTAYNFGFDLGEVVPNAKAFMLSYYETDEEGNFLKNGGTPNWVGFSGRPLAGSILRDEEAYSVVYEKTMQGYFPFTDGWNQPLDEMINMDRLCNFYNHDLKTGANVAPFYGLLYGFMNGIDMEHYQKEVYHSQVCTGDDCKYHIDEEDGQIYNIVTLWRETLEKDENGKYIINSISSMAVAIAYCALKEGIEAPSPLGVYRAEDAVLHLD